MKPESRRFIGPLRPEQSARRIRNRARWHNIASFSDAYNVSPRDIFAKHYETFKRMSREAGCFDI